MCTEPTGRCRSWTCGSWKCWSGTRARFDLYFVFMEVSTLLPDWKRSFGKVHLPGCWIPVPLSHRDTYRCKWCGCKGRTFAEAAPAVIHQRKSVHFHFILGVRLATAVIIPLQWPIFLKIKFVKLLLLTIMPRWMNPRRSLAGRKCGYSSVEVTRMFQSFFHMS